MKKKFLCTVLAGMMVLSMTACGGKNKEENNAATPTVTPTEAPAEPTEAPAEPTETPAADFSAVELLDSIVNKASLPAMMQGSDYELSELYQIDTAALEEFSIYIPMMNVTATEFAIFKAAGTENIEAIVAGVNHRLESLVELWSTYLPEQFELVENHKLLVQGEYVFFIIAEPDIAAYAENVFLRQFDPSLEEVILLRKFNHITATITEISDAGIKLELTEEDKTYSFECSFSDYIYVAGDMSEYAAGDTVSASFEEDVTESEEPMQAVLTYLEKYEVME